MTAPLKAVLILIIVVCVAVAVAFRLSGDKADTGPHIAPFIYITAPHVELGTAADRCATTGTGCVRAVLNLLNAERAAVGVNPLSLSWPQSRGIGDCVGARGHSIHMAKVGHISHDQFPEDLCLSYTTAGENVGAANYGQKWSDLVATHQLMMSEPHDPGTCAQASNHACSVINRSFDTVGIGVWRAADGTTFLTESLMG